LYQTEGALVLKDPGRRENVRASLKALIAEDTLREYASPVEKLLSGMTVVVNEDQIEGVSYRKYTEEGRQFFDLTVKLASEGSDRLWKYSKGRVGSQLMLVVDGVAIAAPRISHELSQSDLTITQLPEQVLVDMTVDAIKARRNPLR
ncbi:MAG: hypothetical protein HYR64_04075, partial [Fimbriimonas ginsengisoli]|nr:hypothetical protein [Fimbriimonas ginsengisoli]